MVVAGALIHVAAAVYAVVVVSVLFVLAFFMFIISFVDKWL